VPECVRASTAEFGGEFGHLLFQFAGAGAIRSGKAGQEGGAVTADFAVELSGDLGGGESHGLGAGFERLRRGFLGTGTTLAQADHLLGFDIPDFQAQTPDDLPGMQRGGFGRFQLGDLRLRLGQAIERNACIQMVYMMVADIGGEPGHDRVHLHVAGRFQCGFLIGPASPIIKGDAGKIMLRIEQVRADGAGDEVRNNQRDHQGRPAKPPGERHADADVQDKRDQAIKVFLRFIAEGDVDDDQLHQAARVHPCADAAADVADGVTDILVEAREHHGEQAPRGGIVNRASAA